jgi:tetratricopeptide (TPR) repeat protein
VPLQRELAQASFDVYLGALPAGAAAVVARDAARESRDALYGLLGLTPEDPWAWERLAEVSRGQGEVPQARDLALRGLAIAPDDAGLLEHFARSARALGGPRAVVDSLEPLCRRHPDVARVAAQLAEARFELARASARNGVDPRAELAAAEAGFARARSLDPSLEDRSREREARCRGALGLWLLDRGSFVEARDAFMAMEDVRPGGLALEIGEGAGRGSDGLYRVAQAYAERGELDSLEQAALIQDLLHAAEPGDARYAFGAGRANREAAVALELHASGLVRTPLAERNRLLEHAREMMERAFRALDDAAALAPEDAHVAAEAGAVLVRYLQRDPERARAFLERAVRLGEAEVRALAAHADPQGRLRLEEARTRVGDACLDLGTLYLTLLGDPKRAVEWLEKSRTAGPDPRPEIEVLLANCRAALAGEIDPRLRDEDRWAAPIRAGKGP